MDCETVFRRAKGESGLTLSPSSHCGQALVVLLLFPVAYRTRMFFPTSSTDGAYARKCLQVGSKRTHRADFANDVLLDWRWFGDGGIFCLCLLPLFFFFFSLLFFLPFDLLDQGSRPRIEVVEGLQSPKHSLLETIMRLGILRFNLSPD